MQEKDVRGSLMEKPMSLHVIQQLKPYQQFISFLRQFMHHIYPGQNYYIGLLVL